MTTDTPRCATCQHWTRFERTEPGVWGKPPYTIDLPVFRGDDGICAKIPDGHMIDIDHRNCYGDGGFYVTTHETFGCVLHEPKEGD